MRKQILTPTLLAAALLCSPLAFATGAQTANTTPSPASSTAMPQNTQQGMQGSGQHWQSGHQNMQGMQQGMHHGMRHHRWHRHGGMMMLHKLDLTSTQQDAIHQMMRQEHAQAKPQMQTLMQKRMEFENATPGSADYQMAADQLGQAEAQAAQARVSRKAAMRTKVYNLLTPAQRTKLASLREEHHADMQKWHANAQSRRTQWQSSKDAPQQQPSHAAQQQQPSEGAQSAVHQAAEGAPRPGSGNQPMPASTSGNEPMPASTSGND